MRARIQYFFIIFNLNIYNLYEITMNLQRNCILFEGIDGDDHEGDLEK